MCVCLSAHSPEILDVLEILGMIEERVAAINTMDDVPVAKPIVQMVVQAKTALQGACWWLGAVVSL